MEGTKFEGDASQVSLPTKEGEITILPHHISLITILTKGLVKTPNQNIEIKGGVAEIDGEKVVVLAH